MCVICYKAKNQKLPSIEEIMKMWNRNPDGAGVMWVRPEDRRIGWKKGFMGVKSLKRFIRKNEDYLSETDVAIHFRITTHGGTCPGNTHPFVVNYEADPHALEGVSDVVMMHNGMLNVTPRRKDFSDSAELAYRAGCFSEPFFYLDTINEFLHGSRILVFDKDGAHFYGDAFKKGEDGLLYSNLNHERRESGSYEWYKYWDDNYGWTWRTRDVKKIDNNTPVHQTSKFDSPEGSSWNDYLEGYDAEQSELSF